MLEEGEWEQREDKVGGDVDGAGADAADADGALAPAGAGHEALQIPLFAHRQALQERGERVVDAEQDLEGDHEEEEGAEAGGGLDAQEG